MKQIDPKRNKTADEGNNDDPQLRDDTVIQPGVSTVSTGKSDEDDQHVTETAADNFTTDDETDAKPDRTFDQVDYD
ncbi:MAG: hypothetical protein ACXWCZ_00165 [Flavisolibacter sp.]